MGTDYHSISVSATDHGAFAWTHQNGKSSGSTPYFFFLLNPGTKTWSKITPTGDPIPRYYTEQGGTVFDSKRDRILLNSYGNMYEYRFSDNVFQSISGGGPSGYQRESVYLPHQDKVYYQGGQLYDCASNSWSSAPISRNTVSTGLAYDKNRDLVWNIEIYHEVYAMRIAGGADPDTLPPVDPPFSGVEKTRKTPNVFSASPNPFNQGVTVRLLGRYGGKNSTLRVFNLRGQMVADLSAQLGPNGKLRWNPNSGRFGILPAGLYLLRWDSGKTTKTIRLMHLH